MSNLLSAPISRRSLLKGSVVLAVISSIPVWSSKVIAQGANAIVSRVGSPKPDGLISFNAGWQIPVEDQKSLLALEETKIKEAQAATSQTAPSVATGPDNLAKPVNKSWKDKVQDVWSKVKGFF